MKTGHNLKFRLFNSVFFNHIWSSTLTPRIVTCVGWSTIWFNSASIIIHRASVPNQPTSLLGFNNLNNELNFSRKSCTDQDLDVPRYTLKTTRTIKNRYRFFEVTLRQYRYAFFKESTSARFLRRTDVMSVLQKNVSILRKNRRHVGFSENVPILRKNRLWNGTSSYETR